MSYRPVGWDEFKINYLRRCGIELVSGENLYLIEIIADAILEALKKEGSYYDGGLSMRIPCQFATGVKGYLVFIPEEGIKSL